MMGLGFGLGWRLGSVLGLVLRLKSESESGLGLELGYIKYIKLLIQYIKLSIQYTINWVALHIGLGRKNVVLKNLCEQKI